MMRLLLSLPDGRGSAAEPSGTGETACPANNALSTLAPTSPVFAMVGQAFSLPARLRAHFLYSFPANGLIVTLCFIAASCAFAQQPMKLTLREAEDLALKNNPLISAAGFLALASGEITTEIRSAYQPTIYGNFTSGGAINNSRIQAGGLNNPIIYNRVASGFLGSQLISDFGRTASLVESSKLRTEGQEQLVKATRAQVVLIADRAYYSALRAAAVLRVAQQTVASRELTADQVKALADSKLRSGLDVSFTNVNLAEAKLLLSSAQNQQRAAYAELAAALALPATLTFELADVKPAKIEPLAEADQLMKEAAANRPELAALRLDVSSAQKFAEAEGRLSKPTLTALGAAGISPAHDEKLTGRYAAVAVNLSIPVFNGHLFSARREEAELRTHVIEQRVKDLENSIARDVAVAALNVETARERIDLTAQLLQHAARAFDLAEQRYNLGLSSAIELSQAQLNKTSAEIQDITAGYDYQLQRAILDFHTGVIR
jgi:outer membrane protein